MKTTALGSFLLLFLVLNVRAATFSVTPTVVSNDYNGLITFQMTGLTTGETVLVQQFYDANSNGIVDAGDLCARSEVVTDGQARLFNGVTNINLFRDEDGSANGAIAASVRFAAAPDIARGIANYIFRFSSPSNHFTATNIAFAVRSVPYNQSVQGAVICGSTNVSNAYVALVQNTAGNVQIVVAGTTADANGNYSLKALPGIYEVLAVQAGYVGNLTNFPVVVLLTNTTVTTNLNLIAADTTISGSLVDSTNALLKVIPNAQLIAYSTNLWFTISEADSNSDFSIPVTSGNLWTVRATAQSAASEGYLVPDASIESHYETFSGPVNNAVVMLKHATALINGRVQDKLGNPVFGINLFANADFGQYNAFALSDSNGLYSMAIDAGAGTVNVQNPANPPAGNYIWPTTQFGINDGQFLSLNVTGLVVTARFRSHVVVDTGVPLAGLQSVADSYEYYGAYTFATTDGSGYLDMPVFGGEWGFGWFSDLPPDLVFPDVPPFTITDGVNLTNDMVARTVTGTVSGYVHDGNGQGITNLTVTVTNHVGLTNYTLHAATDANGNYSVGVFDGTWNVSPDNNALEIQGYVTPVTATNVTVPPAGGVANFVVSAVPPPQILTTSLPDATVSNFYSAGLTVTNGSYPTFWSLTSGALPGGLSLNIFGYIFGTPTNLGPFNFTLKVQDPRGSNDVRALSINVLPAPAGPFQISTTILPSGAVGCPYTNQIVATGGVPPYSWTLASDSGALPDGFGFDTNGLLAGIPTTDGYFYLDFQVTDSIGAGTNAYLSFSVNTVLQTYDSPLPPGEVGLSYYAYPPVSGGAQPQFWSVISNSLPPGLTNDPASGLIYGTPSTNGIYNFTLLASDGCADLDIALSITNYPPPQIKATTLPVAALNVPYTAQLQVDGGVPPYYWFTYDWLGGLSLNADGSISGTPYTAGTNTFLAQVYDGAGGFATCSFDLIGGQQLLLDMPAFSTPGQFSFRVAGISGQSYTVQFTTDLTNWIDLFTTNAPSDVFFLTDTSATNASGFYQLRANQ